MAERGRESASTDLPNPNSRSASAPGRVHFVRHDEEPAPGPAASRLARYLKILAARAITSPRIMREQTACTVIANLPQRASGITSVGLNAVALVKPR